MKIRNSLFLIAALVAGIFFTGCTEEDGTPTGSAPTGVQVTSMGGSAATGYTFGVRWTRASGDVGVNKIVAVPVAGGAEVTATTTSTATTGAITVTTAGKYNIMVESSTGDRSTAVTWATTTRSATIRLWETADNTPGHGSGLVLGTPNETSSTAHATSILGAEKLDIDLVLATDNALPSLPYLSLQGADVAGSGIPGGRMTRLGNQYFIVTGGLDGDFYDANISGEFTNNVNFVPILGTASDPIIILVKTADNPAHYARVQIVKQPSGLLYGEGPAPTNFRYIDVIVSYQPMAGEPYAGRPIGIARGFNTPRVIGGKAVVKN